ncbi:AMP-dependent synthetase [Curtobacterium sp. MCSS17_008]|uniref:AMP-binding protein n=1 Tax=Curtobacterium sp. MCSS17_008 TaxID=2175647 RepID=UPI000DA9BAFD|nr:AMP-binding protein [Curtobacterium sp. MCSS17_008]PZF59546.1 AMP-dependent synthetase [Curtobacterium sp. MCSS17_008]
MPSSNPTTAYRAARDELLAVLDEHDTERAEAARRAFRWPDLGADFNWATDWFDVVARDNDRVALWIVDEDGGSRTTYAEMAARSDRLAVHLDRLGVRKGDHVLLMLGNQLELWETMLAVMKLGAVILPTSTMLDTADLQDRIDRGGVAHVVTNHGETPKFQGVTGAPSRIVVGGAADGWTPYPDDLGRPAPAGEVRPTVTTSTSDPCLVYFTSGTTSRPKMVVHTQASYPLGHLSTMHWLGLRPGDVHLAISSPGWGKHAWSCFFAPWIAEATVFVYDTPRFDPAGLLAQLEDAGVDTFCAPPTAWRMLLQSDLGPKPRALREVVSAGEPLNPEVIARVQAAWGLTIRDGYGQTETTAIIGNVPGAPVTPGAMGRPLPGVAVTLLDPLTGRPGDEGEVCLDLAERPTNLMAGYLGDPDRTADAMRDGFFHTGDIASRDADGQLTFIGRTDDVFKSSDYKVSPFEVESALLQHAAVAESAVVPAPDEARLNVVKAYVTLAAGWEPTAETARTVLEHARVALPAYARVRRVEFGSLPKTISGKIRRVELREREERAAAGAPAEGEWREEQFPELRSVGRRADDRRRPGRQD